MPIQLAGKPLDTNVIVIDTPEKAQRLNDELMGQFVAAFDTETVGQDIRKETPVGRARVISWSVCFGEDKSFFIPCYDGNRNYKGNPSKWGLDAFKTWFASDTCNKIAHNAKYDIHTIRNMGLKINGIWGCSQVMAWLKDETLPHKLEDVIKQELDEDYLSFKDTFAYWPFMKSGKLRHKVPKGIKSLNEIIDPNSPHYQPCKLEVYGAKDSWIQWRAFWKVRDKLANIPWYGGTKNMWDYYRKFELPFMMVLVDMEREGIWVDDVYLQQLDDEWTEEINECESRFVKLAIKGGVRQKKLKDLNFNSDAQLREILFEDLKLPPLKVTGKTKQYSVDADTLHYLAGKGHKVVEPLSRRAILIKLRGTYAGPLIHHRDKRGRIHCSLNQGGTGTGRISSSNPNLQTIPIRSEDGAKIREAFRASEGKTLLVGDSSQIELRFLAHFAKDKKMIDGFEAGKDFHAYTAQLMYEHLCDIDPDVIKEEYTDERGNAKNVNFGIAYGQGPAALAVKLDITKQEAIELINKHDSAFPGISRLKRNTLQFAREQEIVRTLTRRYCRVPKINSNDYGIRGYMERKAFNATIQGSAADMMKMSMILIHQDEKLRKMGCKMLLQVHDELVNETPKGTEKRAGKRVQHFMEHPFKYFGMKPLRVSTPAGMVAVANWKLGK